MGSLSSDLYRMKAFQVLLVFLCSLVLASANQSEERQIQLQNVSLVITYTGIVVAVLMMAGFLYVALNFGGRRSSYGYGYDEYEYNYSKRSPEPSVLAYLLNHLTKYEEDDE